MTTLDLTPSEATAWNALKLVPIRLLPLALLGDLSREYLQADRAPLFPRDELVAWAEERGEGADVAVCQLLTLVDDAAFCASPESAR